MKGLILLGIVVIQLSSCRLIKNQCHPHNQSIYVNSNLKYFFAFERKYGKILTKSFLVDSLFRSFDVREGIEFNIGNKKAARKFLEFRAVLNASADQALLRQKENVYRFYQAIEEGYELGAANINFNSDNLRKVIDTGMFKLLLRDTLRVDIDDSKKKLNNVFRTKKRTFFLAINDDSQTVYLFFDHNKLAKAFFEINLND